MTNWISSGSFDDARRPVSLRSIICLASASRSCSGGRDHALSDSEQPGFAITMPAPIDRDGLQADVESGQMRRGGDAGLEQDRRCQQPTKPGRVLQHLQLVSVVEGDDRLQYSW